MQELLGIPINEIFPDKDIWDVVSSSSYCSGVVHIPGEISNPLTIVKLSDLNQFLVIIRYEFFGGEIQPLYTQSLQRELDVTSAELLPAKLDFMFNREYENWYNLDRTSFVPSPLEELNYYPFLF